MSRIARFMVTTAVASLLLASTLVSAQAPKAELKGAGKAEGLKAEVFLKGFVVVPPAAKGAVVVQGGANPFAPHFVQQLRPILLAEYHFLCKTGDLTKEQRDKIAPLAEEMVNKLARDLGDLQMEMQRRARLPTEKTPDPRDLLRSRLGVIARPLLSPAQAARYDQEVKKRAEHRKRIGVEHLVAMVDRELMLTPDQRTALSKALSERWGDAWRPSDEIPLLGPNARMRPQVPYEILEPIFTPAQRSVWISHATGQVYFATGYIANNPVENSQLNDGDLPAPQPAPALPAPPPAAVPKPAMKVQSK